jgi:hypothetical protein
MKKAQKVIGIVLLFFSSMSWAQESHFLAVIKVTFSSSSGIEDSDISIASNQNLFFIESDSKEDMYFYNVLLEEETQSAGIIKNVKHIKKSKTQNEYAFEWYYENSYNEVKGKAYVTIEIMDSTTTNSGKTARVTITDDQKLHLVYEGEINYFINPLVFLYRLEAIK